MHILANITTLSGITVLTDSKKKEVKCLNFRYYGAGHMMLHPYDKSKLLLYHSKNLWKGEKQGKAGLALLAGLHRDVF